MAGTETTRGARKVALSQARPNRRRGGDLRVMLSPVTVDATSGFMGSGILEPGEFVAEHYHPHSEEFLYLVKGSIVVTVDGVPIRLEPDEALMVPIGARHRITNDGTTRAQVVFHLSPLAPSPELGHVDLEELPNAGTLPEVGAPARDGEERR